MTDADLVSGTSPSSRLPGFDLDVEGGGASTALAMSAGVVAVVDAVMARRCKVTVERVSTLEPAYRAWRRGSDAACVSRIWSGCRR